MQRHEGQDGFDEALSALMDGDVPEDEASRLLERIAREPGLRARWSRYHAVRSRLQGSRGKLLSDGFAERVQTAVAQEPAILAPQSYACPRPMASAAPVWVRPVAGVAIAASVALLAVGGLFALQQTPPQSGDISVAAFEGQATASPQPSRLDGSRAATPAALTLEGDAVLASDAARARIGRYLASHSEFAGNGRLPGVISYSRLTGYNAGQ